MVSSKREEHEAAESAAELGAGSNSSSRVSSKGKEQTAAARARSRQPAYQNPHQQLSSTTAIVGK